MEDAESTLGGRLDEERFGCGEPTPPRVPAPAGRRAVPLPWIRPRLALGGRHLLGAPPSGSRAQMQREARLNEQPLGTRRKQRSHLHGGARHSVWAGNPEPPPTSHSEVRVKGLSIGPIPPSRELDRPLDLREATSRNPGTAGSPRSPSIDPPYVERSLILVSSCSALISPCRSHGAALVPPLFDGSAVVLHQISYGSR